MQKWRAAFSVLGVIGLLVAWQVIYLPHSMHWAKGRKLALDDYRGRSPTGVPTELLGASSLIRGKYLAKAADCQACHTRENGTPFAGGRAFVLPFGTLYAPNITPDTATGIGTWSDADFLNAVHKGVRKDGKRLYPAFPYAAYTLMTDQDALAIKAYLFSLAPVQARAPENKLAFPFNQRWLMVIWSFLYNPDQRFRPVEDQTAEWNRGAYLVEGPGHCGDCHTSRNLLQAPDTRRPFSGAKIDGWTAYNITSDRHSGLGGWSQSDLEQYLSTGHSDGHGTASGPMAEVVDLSLRQSHAIDIHAIALYLRSVPAIHSSSLPDRLAGPAPASANLGFVGDGAGQKIFASACAGCHTWQGAGAAIPQAALTGARAINDPGAENVARMILKGAGRPNSGKPYMPPFGAAYSDQEVAEVSNYVTARFGAKPSHLTAKQVARMRRP